MLSRTGAYALRAVMLLATGNRNRALTVGEIAVVLGVPRNYLAKTLQRLVRRGVLRSVRGPGGGFALARPASSLPLSAVLSEFDEVGPLATCVLGDLSCDEHHPCAAHTRWQAWSRELARLLDGTTVGDLVAGPDQAGGAVGTILETETSEASDESALGGLVAGGPVGGRLRRRRPGGGGGGR